MLKYMLKKLKFPLIIFKMTHKIIYFCERKITRGSGGPGHACMRGNNYYYLCCLSTVVAQILLCNSEFSEIFSEPIHQGVGGPGHA